MKEAVRRLFATLGHDLRNQGHGLQLTRRWGNVVRQDLHRLLGTASLVLDVGANEGQAALELAETFPHATVHSWEPNPAAFDRLTRNVAANKRIVPHAGAIGSSEAVLPLTVTKNDVGSSFLPFTEPGARGDWTEAEKTVDVPVQRLDAALQALKISKADLLKIDTQGFDLEVLKGAGEMLTPDTIRGLLIEVCFEPFYKGQGTCGEIFDFVIARGYRPVAIYEGERRKGGQLLWCDVVFG